MVGGDDRDSILHQGLEGRCFKFRRKQSYAVDAPQQHAAQRPLGAGGVEVGTGDEQLLFVLDQELFENLDGLSEKRIGEIGNDDSVNLALTVLEVNGAIVGNKLQVLNDLANPLRGAPQLP